MHDAQESYRRLYRFLDELATSHDLPAVPYARSSSVFAKGDVAQSLFLLRAGRVKISRSGGGRREIVLRIVESGRVFGEEGFAGAEPRGVDARALEEMLATAIPRSMFLEGVEKKPDAALWLAELLDRRRVEAIRQVDLLCVRNVQHRLVLLLGDLAVDFGKSEAEPPAIRLKQDDLAGLIGATRETTSVNLNVLARRGLIEIGRCILRIKSLDALHHTAGEIRGRMESARSPRSKAADASA